MASTASAMPINGQLVETVSTTTAQLSEGSRSATLTGENGRPGGCYYQGPRWVITVGVGLRPGVAAGAGVAGKMTRWPKYLSYERGLGQAVGVLSNAELM
jgi:hypothetical protein